MKLQVVLAPGSGLDGPDELCARSGCRLDANGSVDGGAGILRFLSPGSARSFQSDTKMTSGFGDAGVVSPDQSAAIERLADAVMRLARRNEALEDFAALVAHELKSPLEAALLGDDPRRWIVSALDLVESLLQAGRASTDGAWASLSDCLAEAACRLHPIELTVAADESMRFPLPPRSLSVILRNLLANAAAAKARHVDVFAAHRRGQWWLVVDDDGVGVGAHGHEYDHGSGIGLELCRRIAGRNGGRLELVPRCAGGTRAVLTMERAA
jgi:signal transduction histidine kinase